MSRKRAFKIGAFWQSAAGPCLHLTACLPGESAPGVSALFSQDGALGWPLELWGWHTEYPLHPHPGDSHYPRILHREAPRWCTLGDWNIVFTSLFGDRS